MGSLFILPLLLLASSTSAQPGATVPIASRCGPTTADIQCINHYGAVMPYPFFRNASSGPFAIPPLGETYGSTSVPSDPSFANVSPADFLVFDEELGLRILGSSPSVTFMFDLPPLPHEAPVYVAAQKKLYFSQFAGPNSTQIVIDFNDEPPTLSSFISDPPINTPGGGTFHDGKIIWAVQGANNSIPQRSGLASVDPQTGKAEWLINNYFGFYFSGPDDIVVDSAGDIWFTDSDYAWFFDVSDTAPQGATGTYRFRPSTGEAFLVEDTLVQPNGIAISPDGKTLYIGDSAYLGGTVDPSLPPMAVGNVTSARNVYAFDIVTSPGGAYLINRRPIYRALEWGPDGLKVAKNGYVLTATGKGLDVLDPYGKLLLRAQTNITVQNFAWTGDDLKTVWMVGIGGAVKIEWDLEGPPLV